MPSLKQAALSADKTVVIVGSSVAGVRTARALRTQEFGGRIVLIGKEAGLPYDKPPLSKQFLAGTWDVDRLTLLAAEDAEAAGIELLLGSAAERLDIAARMVYLVDGTAVPYDVLVVATGADARPSPWPVESGMHVVRTLDDGRRLADDLTSSSGPVVVIGGGFIGAEVAATAHAMGRTVTIIDPLGAPIGRILGEELAPMFNDLHRRHGVTTRFGEGVESVEGTAGNLKVTMTNGETLQASIVVVGIGARPNDGWLESSGLLIADGVVCDEFCRAADHSEIFAVGDVARWYHPRHREDVRVEHWTNASEQAACVAHNILHPAELRPYGPVEFVWSDQYDWKIQIAGRPGRADFLRLIGNLQGERPRAAAIYSDESGVIRGAVTVNWPKAILACRRLIGSEASAASALAEIEQLHRVGTVPSV
ncbi:FAD-dependent oxidoreductase [Mycobacterium sp. CVI_P3]|uniref:FAD-dependent oxidoreductase n=1 Tax=Mycobacterium pinniadriaticum TaxID=2994102 RepID=A0ABT3SL01_9MYCO|nr:FAD-dependent oxidoreductase [Mycobacterium pinniadriaticum]MCX2933711.1 FAD-dependent oxidoreductase [Mycobacterium pinniadriaticum]MCX2940133.1 FAD-dependent oxidoreductase [Mycobacterium pinniadriaticum]